VLNENGALRTRFLFFFSLSTSSLLKLFLCFTVCRFFSCVVYFFSSFVVCFSSVQPSGPLACDFGADIKGSEIGDECVTTEQDVLRPIVIDGSNVAMGHGNKEVFSCRGIAICVDWFKQRGE
jgi:hypothetical protein